MTRVPYEGHPELESHRQALWETILRCFSQLWRAFPGPPEEPEWENCKSHQSTGYEPSADGSVRT